MLKRLFNGAAALGFGRTAIYMGACAVETEMSAPLWTAGAILSAACAFTHGVSAIRPHSKDEEGGGHNRGDRDNGPGDDPEPMPQPSSGFGLTLPRPAAREHTPLAL